MNHTPSPCEVPGYDSEQKECQAEIPQKCCTKQRVRRAKETFCRLSVQAVLDKMFERRRDPTCAETVTTYPHRRPTCPKMKQASHPPFVKGAEEGFWQGGTEPINSKALLAILSDFKPYALR